MSRQFKTTQWALIASARDAPSDVARDALSALCQQYWYPVYSYIRCKGHSNDQAKDLAQEFFCEFVDRKFFRNVSPEKGHFRSYVIASVKNFLANERRKANTLKRGGGKIIISMDAFPPDYVLSTVSAAGLDPRQLFDQQWAVVVIERAMRRLEEETSKREYNVRFELLRDVLTGSIDALPYRELGDMIGKSEGAVSVFVHRLRNRFGELVREEVAQTVSKPEEIDEEIQYLFAALDP